MQQYIALQQHQPLVVLLRNLVNLNNNARISSMENFLTKLEQKINKLLSSVNKLEHEVQELSKENQLLHTNNIHAICQVEKMLLRLKTLERELVNHDNSTQ